MPVTPQKNRELAERMRALGLRESDLRETFVRGHGHGGQKVNKSNNCVCLIHEASGLVIKCHREREREVNRYLARRALCDELEHRLGLGPSRRQRELERSAGRKGRTGSPRSLTVVARKSREPREEE